MGAGAGGPGPRACEGEGPPAPAPPTRRPGPIKRISAGHNVRSPHLATNLCYIHFYIIDPKFLLLKRGQRPENEAGGHFLTSSLVFDFLKIVYIITSNTT